MADRLEAKEVDFLPCNNAIVLRDVNLAEEAENRYMRETMDQLKGDVEKLVVRMADGEGDPQRGSSKMDHVVEAMDEALQEHTGELAQRVETIKQEQTEMQGTLRTLVAMLHMQSRGGRAPADASSGTSATKNWWPAASHRVSRADGPEAGGSSTPRMTYEQLLKMGDENQKRLSASR